MPDPTPITWHLVPDDDHTFIAVVGPLRIQLMRSGAWSVAMPPLLDRAFLPETIDLEEVEGAQTAALRLAAQTLEPYANAYSDIEEWGMR